MNADARKQSQEDFMANAGAVVVATNAFGMGINKTDIRFVVHYNIPAAWRRTTRRLAAQVVTVALRSAFCTAVRVIALPRSTSSTKLARTTPCFRPSKLQLCKPMPAEAGSGISVCLRSRCVAARFSTILATALRLRNAPVMFAAETFALPRPGSLWRHGVLPSRSLSGPFQMTTILIRRRATIRALAESASRIGGGK